MLGRFLDWWGAGLRVWLPRSPRASRAERATSVCLLLGEQELVWLSEHGAEAERLGAWPAPTTGAPAKGAHEIGAIEVPEGARVRIRFDPSRALTREVELPIATEENLAQVLRFEMERLTPFRAEDVYHRYAVVGRDERHLRLRLLVVPRTVVEPVLALVGESGLDPGPDEQHGADPQDVLELEFRTRDYQPRRTGLLVPALVAINALLLIGLGLVVIDRQDRAIERLDSQMRVSMGNATRADELRRRLESLLGAGDFLLEQRRARPAAVVLLEELSAVLPDGTALSRLEFRAREVHLHGTSTSASALIALLDASELLSGARFASPMLRDGASGRDRFHIAVQVDSPEAGG